MNSYAVFQSLLYEVRTDTVTSMLIPRIPPAIPFFDMKTFFEPFINVIFLGIDLGAFLLNFPFNGWLNIMGP